MRRLRRGYSRVFEIEVLTPGFVFRYKIALEVFKCYNPFIVSYQS